MNKSPSDLILAATQVRQNAHAPYSQFRVGAAFRTVTGEIITGCNVEFISFGLTVCAERNALCAAIAQGHKKFTECAVVTDIGVTCCGMCRQVIWDLCGDIPIHIADEKGDIKTYTTKELLPNAYNGPQG